MENQKISPNICFVKYLMWIPRKCCYLRQMVDVQALWVKLLQWDVGGVQPINLARHCNEKIKSDKRFTHVSFDFFAIIATNTNSISRFKVTTAAIELQCWCSYYHQKHFRVAPGDRIRRGPCYPAVAALVPRPRCSGTWKKIQFYFMFRKTQMASTLINP